MLFNQIDFSKLGLLFQFDKSDPLFFSSSMFMFLFAGLLIVLRLLRTRNLQTYFLILFSLFFYYKASGPLIALLLASVVVNYSIGLGLPKLAEGWRRRVLLLLGLGLNIGALGYFKYTNFFLQLAAEYKGAEFTPLEIILPIGISYYTFKAISYLIDVYIELTEPTRSFRDFTLYMFFFPNILQGPIDRARDFLPQISETPVFTREVIGKAVFLIILGLLKKNAIADYISVNFVERVFDVPTRYTGFEILVAMYGYALQIYCDFSGYTDIALGIALLLGFKIMDNFNYPYKATSIADFWRRWHISLSTWLQEYLFKPMQMGMRSMRMAGNIIALIVTFFISGLWHGAGVNFILWGTIHGLIMAVGLAVSVPKKWILEKTKLLNTPIHKFFQIFITFHIIVVTWVIFRVPTIAGLKEILEQMKTAFHFEVWQQFIEGYPIVVGVILGGYLLHFLPSKMHEIPVKFFGKMHPLVLALLLGIAIFVVGQVKSSELQPFIYLQF